MGYFKTFCLKKENIAEGLIFGFPFIIVGLYLLFLSLIYIKKYIGFLEPNYFHAIIVIVSLIGSGVFEEIFFRGIILNILINKCKISKLFSIIISSFIFGISHLYNFKNGFGYFNIVFSQIFYIFVLGLFFSIIYLKYKNIWPVILIHIILNFMGIIPFALFSSLEQFQTLHSIDIVAFINILIALSYLLFFIKIYKAYYLETSKNNYLLGYFISIQDNKEYKIYTNGKSVNSVIHCLNNNDFYIERIICNWQINNKNEHFNRLLKCISSFWNSLSKIQIFCFIIIFIAVIIAITVVFNI